MLLQTWGDVLVAQFQQIGGGLIGFIPKLVVSLVIFLVGWALAVIISRAVEQIIRALKVDSALQGLGFENVLRRGGFKLDSGGFIGGLVRWFFIVVFLVAAVDVLGLLQVNLFLRETVLLYIPNVIVAALILVVAAVLAEAVQKLIKGSVRAAGMPSAAFLGGVTRWAIWIFAILAALFQLGIAGPFVQTIFTGFIAMLTIAGGLAFGLGGRDAAAKYIDRLRSDISR